MVYCELDPFYFEYNRFYLHGVTGKITYCPFVGRAVKGFFLTESCDCPGELVATGANDF